MIAAKLLALSRWWTSRVMLRTRTPRTVCKWPLSSLFAILVFYCPLHKIIVFDCILPVLRTWSRSCSPCTSRRTPTPSSAPHRPRQLSEHHPNSTTISQDNYKDYQLLTVQCEKSSIYVHYILIWIAFQMINWIQSTYVKTPSVKTASSYQMF